MPKPLGVVWIADVIEQALIAEAARHFPRETGGLLLGYWATPFSELVITDAVGPGPRAVHQLTGFHPDTAYQAAEIARRYEASGRLHTYIGDWHTHPNGSHRLSRLDRQTLRRIADYGPARAPIPIMAILAGGAPWRLAVWRLTPWQLGRWIFGQRPALLRPRSYSVPLGSATSCGD